MVISVEGFGGIGDPARLAAQVVSGVGFLGAGTIIVRGKSIYGLTTAASLWVCACLGLTVGIGFYFEALTALGVVIFALWPLNLLQKKMFKVELSQTIAVSYRGILPEINKIYQCVNSESIRIEKMEIHEDIKELLIMISGQSQRELDKTVFKIMETSEIIGFTRVSESD